MSDGKTRYADDQTLAYIAKLEAERDKLKEQREYWMGETARLRDADRTLIFVCDKLIDERDKLRDALHRISLGAQNSGTTKEALGKEARAALQEAKHE